MSQLTDRTQEKVGAFLIGAAVGGATVVTGAVAFLWAWWEDQRKRFQG